MYYMACVPIVSIMTPVVYFSSWPVMGSLQEAEADLVQASGSALTFLGEEEAMWRHRPNFLDR